VVIGPFSLCPPDGISEPPRPRVLILHENVVAIGADAFFGRDSAPAKRTFLSRWFLVFGQTDAPCPVTRALVLLYAYKGTSS
jgi:hypothetical protein